MRPYAGDVVRHTRRSCVTAIPYITSKHTCILHVPVVSLRHNPELQYRNLSTVVTRNFKVVPGTPILYYLKRIGLLKERVHISNHFVAPACHPIGAEFKMFNYSTECSHSRKLSYIYCMCNIYLMSIRTFKNIKTCVHDLGYR
jgi:hypothetical protein